MDTEISSLIDKATNLVYEKINLKQFEIASVIANQVLKIDPENHQIQQLLGVCYQNLKRYKDAREAFEKCLKINPNEPESLNNLALTYASEFDYKKACEILIIAVEKNPKASCIHNNLGLQYRSLEEHENAISCFKKSLELKNDSKTWAMMGGCYGELKQLDKAEKCFLKALNLDPDFAAAHTDLACVYQLKGDWKQGFKEYEWRFNVYEQLKVWKKLYDQNKRWKGQDISGKKLLVHTEQGIGDGINFIRYLPILKTRGIHLTLHCSEPILPLVQSFADEFFSKCPSKISTEDLPDHDFNCPVMSLPHILNLDYIPNDPYIFISEKIKIEKYNDKIKIGIVWAGNPEHSNDRKRSCELKMFKGLHDLNNVKLFSLMKDTRKRAYNDQNKPIDLTEGSENMQIVDFSEQIKSFYDTALIINSLDIIIGVDTSVLHLAGAMGKPCCLLLSKNNDWRWKSEGETTLWYPNMKLFRQEKNGDWSSVFEKVEKYIKKGTFK